MFPMHGRLTRYDTKAVSDAAVRVFPDDEPELVQQHLQDEVDINTIVRRFGMTPEIPDWKARGVYGDFTGISDFESAVEKIRSVSEQFMRLSPTVREKFENDPGKLVAYAESVTPEEFDAMLAPPVPVEPLAPVSAPVAPVVP